MASFTTNFSVSKYNEWTITSSTRNAKDLVLKRISPSKGQFMIDIRNAVIQDFSKNDLILVPKEQQPVVEFSDSLNTVANQTEYANDADFDTLTTNLIQEQNPAYPYALKLQMNCHARVYLVSVDDSNPLPRLVKPSDYPFIFQKYASVLRVSFNISGWNKGKDNGRYYMQKWVREIFIPVHGDNVIIDQDLHKWNDYDIDALDKFRQKLTTKAEE